MKKNFKKLALSIGLDAIGFIPNIDIAWAPISAIVMTKMYPGKQGKIAAVISFVEEAVPFSDFIPTFTLMWVYTTYFDKENIDKNEVVL